MNSLDYRRFDHLGSDSDEESTGGFSEGEMRALQNEYARFNAGSAGESTSGARHGTGRIQVHPADTTAPAWVYTDPETWVAPVDPGELAWQRDHHDMQQLRPSHKPRL